MLISETRNASVFSSGNTQRSATLVGRSRRCVAEECMCRSPIMCSITSVARGRMRSRSCRTLKPGANVADSVAFRRVGHFVSASRMSATEMISSSAWEIVARRCRHESGTWAGRFHKDVRSKRWPRRDD